MIFMKKQLTGLLPNFITVFRQPSTSFLNMNVLEYGRSSTGLCNKKTAPYDAVFVSAANWAFHLEDGIVKMGASALAFKKLLDQHVYCTQNNDFDGAQIFIQPGFKGRRIMVPDTPAFEKNKMFNFYNNQEQ